MTTCHRQNKQKSINNRKMEKIEIIGMNYNDLQRLIDESQERLIKKLSEEKGAPSDFEELTLEEASKELHCHKATIRRKMLALGIKGNRIGKEITIQRKELKKIRKAP